MMLQLIAQLPDAAEAVKRASEEGWVATVFVVIVLASFTCFGWMIRYMTTRHSQIEERMQTEAKERKAKAVQQYLARKYGITLA